MFCNFCGKPIPQGEAYCSGCADKARSNRPKAERESELSDIKSDLRKRQKTKEVARNIGKKELYIVAALLLAASFFASLIYAFHLKGSVVGLLLIDFGVGLALGVAISKRHDLSKILFLARCLAFIAVMIFMLLFSSVADGVSKVFFVGALLINLLGMALFFRSQSISFFFSFEE